MKKRVFVLSVMIGLSSLLAIAQSALSAQGASGGDVQRGQKLHDASCLTDCHAQRANGNANNLYTRPNHKDSLEKLKSQVEFCNQQVLSSDWFPEDVADVVAYLNQTFYHFKVSEK
ncbi:MAG: hypothetical protein H7832_00340 [Magnetococcus sp. DMHC-6]